jgi:hypothetical protein
MWQLLGAIPHQFADAPRPPPASAPIAESTHMLAGVGLFEIMGTVAFKTEFLKLPAGRGRGQWGLAMIGKCAEELAERGAARYDLLVRTHRKGTEGADTFVPFPSTKAAIGLYDQAGLPVMPEDFPHVNGYAPFEGEQEYRSGDVEELAGLLDEYPLPDDVSVWATTQCRLTRNEWWERDAIAAMRALHSHPDPDVGDQADVKEDLLPRNGRRKLCVYFFVPRRN